LIDATAPMAAAAKLTINQPAKPSTCVETGGKAGRMAMEGCMLIRDLVAMNHLVRIVAGCPPEAAHHSMRFGRWL
jgi:hypothetical protein